MAEAWDHVKGQTDEQMRNNALAIRAVNDENRRLRSDLAQHRMARESLGNILTTGQSGTAALPRAESTLQRPRLRRQARARMGGLVRRRHSRCMLGHLRVQ
eukprot:2231407-Pyramimonas_sp.AAC.1